MKKKLLCVFLAVCCLLAVGCGKKVGPDGTTSATEDENKPPQESAEALRFDGVYIYQDEEDYCYTFRFFEDGSLVNVTSDFDYVTSAENLKQSDVNQGTVRGGSYTLKGSHLAFATDSEAGRVEYKGKIKNNELHLHVHSMINGNDVDRVYKFFAY